MAVKDVCLMILPLNEMEMQSSTMLRYARKWNENVQRCLNIAEYCRIRWDDRFHVHA